MLVITHKKALDAIQEDKGTLDKIIDDLQARPDIRNKILGNPIY